MENLQPDNYSMINEIENIKLTQINNKVFELFNEPDVLGLYVYFQMMVQHESTTLVVIIDRIVEKFKVDQDFVMFLLKRFEKEGLIYVVRK